MTDKQSEQIERLYFELFAQMTAYAGSVLKNRALAEEAVQETFRIACMKPESLCASPNPKGWLLLTLKNVLHNTVRSVASANIAPGFIISNKRALIIPRVSSFSGICSEM